jgi:coproporphyrinogen III oxidase-like Fe-S oxidoreductase
MGLRLSEGIDAGAIARRFGLDSIVDWARVDRLVASGHLDRTGSRIALTSRGRLVLDAILGEIAAVPISAEAAAAPLPALLQA